jgi:VWFA-related protein
MTRTLGYPAILACALGVVTTAGQQQPVFRGEADLVRVFVTVVNDDSGRIVTDLTQADFEVRDEGKVQPIKVFDNSPQPVRLVVMLDVSTSMSGSLGLLRAGSDELFKRLLPDDRVRVGSFGREVTISPTFTNDLNALRRELPTEIKDNAPTPLWRGVDQAMNALKEDPGERRVVLALSDGQDAGPLSFSRKERWVSPGEVIDRAVKEDVMFYAIGMRATGTRGVQPGASLGDQLAADLPDPGLAQVALQTGGGYSEIRHGQDLGAAFARVADELHSQYLLGYDPPKRDGKTHKIEVKVLKRGLKTRARKSYVAQKD